MAIAYVQGKAGGLLATSVQTVTATLDTPSTQHTLLLAAVTTKHSATTFGVPTGWSQLAIIQAQTQTLTLYQYVDNPGGISSFTATMTDTADGMSAILAEVSGMGPTISLDKTATANAASQTLMNSGTTATTTSANEFWFGLLAYGSGAVRTISGVTTGFTAPAELIADSTIAGNTHGAHVSGYYKIPGVTGTANVNATLSTGSTNVGLMVCLISTEVTITPISVSQSSTGAESVLLATITPSLSESGMLAESVLLTTITPSLSDLGMLAESVLLTVAPRLSESGTLAESVAITTITPSLSDLGTLAESVAITTITPSLSDLGTLAESVAITVPRAVTESGTLTEGVGVTTLAATLLSTILADGPTALYAMQELSGTVAHDTSGNGYNATITGGVTLGAAGPATDGGYTSFTLDGSTGYLALPVGVSFNGASNFTVELVFNQLVAQAGTARVVAAAHTDAAKLGFQCALNQGTANGGLFDIGNGTTEYNTYWSGAFALATWHHLICVLQSTGHLYAYLDGTQVGSGAVPANTTVLNDIYPINIGRGPYANDYYKGGIAITALYNGVALTPTQVAAHYAAFLASATPSSVTDTATLGEVAQVAVQLGVAETPAVLGEVAQVAVQLGVTDAPSGGGDTALITVSLPVSDLGSGTEGISVAPVALSVGETGLLTDVPSLTPITLSGTDTSSGGADLVGLALVTAGLSDLGGGGASVTLSVASAVGDPSSGAEGLVLTPVLVPTADLGVGSDQASLTAPITLSVSDPALGAESVLLGGYLLSVAETGVGSDQASFTTPITLSMADPSSATDLAELGVGTLGVSDPSSGAEGVNVTGIAPGVSASGVLSDVVALTVTPAIPSQGATGADVPTLGQITVATTDPAFELATAHLLVAFPAWEPGTGLDVPSVALITPTLADLGLGSAGFAATVLLSVAETGVGSDQVAALLQDPAVGGAILTFAPILVDSGDLATAADLPSLRVLTATADLGVAADAPWVLGSSALADLAVGGEGITFAPITVMAADLGVAADGAAVLLRTFGLTETAVGGEVAQQLARDDVAQGGELLLIAAHYGGPRIGTTAGGTALIGATAGGEPSIVGSLITRRGPLILSSFLMSRGPLILGSQGSGPTITAA